MQTTNRCRPHVVVLAVTLLFPPLVATSRAQTATGGLQLISAARRADHEAIRTLRADGVDVTTRYGDGTTALHAAVYLGGALLVPFLIEQGAAIDAINGRGQTPWLIAAQGEYRSGSFYTQKATGEILAQLGADTTLGEDLGKDFKAVLEARQDAQR